MQFVIIANDGKNMLEKRLAVRPRHLENMAQIKGKVICAGGILDEEGKMAGSVMILEFASRDLFNEYLANEPYIIEKVWENVRVEQMNVVMLNGEKIGK